METRREGLKRANTWVLFNTRELLLQVPRAHIDRSCTNLLSQRHAKSSTHLLRIHKLFIASPAYRLGHFSLSSFDPIISPNVSAKTCSSGRFRGSSSGSGSNQPLPTSGIALMLQFRRRFWIQRFVRIISHSLDNSQTLGSTLSE